MEQEMISYGAPTDGYANLGSTVGKCLADIHKYKDANHFLVDISKKTMVTGSMSYIIMEVPVMQYFFVAGGLTFTFYNTFKNEATNATEKMKQLSYSSITAIGSIGSAVAGMALGQILIPIPFLGAFIGGVVGGFFGEKGSKSLASALEKGKF